MNQLRIAGAWLRRQVGCSNSRRSWYERLGVLALAGGATGGWWISHDWPGSARLALLCAWLMLLTVVVRRGAVRFLGPIFFFELLRGSRKRVHLTRTVYALLLLGIISYTYLIRTEAWERHGSQVNLQVQSDTAFTFFLVFFVVQMMAVAILTPVMVAGAIAEDKDRRTLEFVLATDLRSREIVLGKLAGRMANIGLFLLAGLPILSLLQLLGGIDPDLLLVSLAVTGLTFGSVAAVSIWQSTILRRGRDAIVMTFLTIIGYLAVSGAARTLLLTDFALWKVSVFGEMIYGKDAIDWFGAGNPFVHLASIAARSAGRGGSFYDLIPGILTEYAIFHVLVMVAGITWSVLRLRPVALNQGVGEVRTAGRGRRLPLIGAFPMHWKELFAEPGMRLHWSLRLPIYLIVLLSFLPPVIITREHWERLGELPRLASMQTPERKAYFYYSDPWQEFGRTMNMWVRSASGLVGSLLLLAVAARAAGSVSGERSRQTFDELLVSPLTNDEIVSGKWYGSLFGMRRAWLWLALIYFTGLATGGVNFLGAVLAIAAWFCFAAFMTSLGLWFSVQHRSTLKASLATILSALFVMGGHWLVTGLFCYLPMSQTYGDRDVFEWMTAAQLGVTPPAVLVAAPMYELKELEDLRDRAVKVPVFMVFGSLAFLAAALAMKAATVVRLAEETGRTRIRRPQGRPPKVPSPAPAAEPIRPETV